MCKLKQMKGKSEKAHASRPLSKVKYTKKDDLILFSYFCFCILLLSLQPGPTGDIEGEWGFSYDNHIQTFHLICQRERNCSPIES